MSFNTRYRQIRHPIEYRFAWSNLRMCLTRNQYRIRIMDLSRLKFHMQIIIELKDFL